MVLRAHIVVVSIVGCGEEGGGIPGEHGALRVIFQWEYVEWQGTQWFCVHTVVVCCFPVGLYGVSIHIVVLCVHTVVVCIVGGGDPW